MTAPARIAAFGLLLAAIFAGSLALGGALDPSRSQAEGEPAAGHGGSGSMGMAGDAGGEHGTPPGLQVAQDGYRLELDRTRFAGGRDNAELSFRIVGPDGDPVRRFQLEHEKRMHFIVVRRDLTGFQHLHPAMAHDGTWKTRADLATGGVYRVFADFKHAGVKRTLGNDLQVSGPNRPRALPGTRPRARVANGLEVTMRAEATRAGEPSRVEFDVRERGKLVNDRLQGYLGAAGHLVALRAGDLAYLHTHPDGEELAFAVEYPSAGSYRLFVQFRYRGTIQTAAFTRTVRR
jgi:hypothetical protein